MKKLLIPFLVITILFAARPALADFEALFDSILGAGLSNIGSDAYQLTNPENPKTPALIVADAIEVALGLLGIIFLALIVFAGFRWLFAAGDTGVIDKARGILIHSVIGLIIILAAYSITYFLIQNILKASQEGEESTMDF